MQTVGLCMIVRDEAAVIERCLESVRPLIDSWTICDTGSVDGTPAVVEGALAGLPGTLEHRPWRDFGTNRTELMELARASADYLLLIDADMTLERRGPLPPLSSDAYLLRDLGPLDYAVPRLVRGDRHWWYAGATHEYLASDGPYTQEPLEALAIRHHGDGGTRHEKFARDVALLEAALRRDPSDARASFYLAQTLRESGREERAIEIYRRRIALGGWEEEVFYAAYQLGVLVGRREPEGAIPLLLDAFERRPGRAEPLHELARLSRLRGRHHSAYMFARRAAEIPYPADVLFVHRDVYAWGIAFEQAVSAYWVGEYGEALALNERLLAEGSLPSAHVRAVVANRRYCLEALGRPADPPPVPLLSDLADTFETAEIELQVDPPWSRFNPTLASDGKGFRAIVRTANYRLTDTGAYDIADADGVVRTLNYLVELDGALELRSVQAIVDDAGGPPSFPSRIEGYEDLRLIRVGARWYATATARDRNPVELCAMALLELDGPRITAAHMLRGPDPARHEKNWMPFLRDGRLHLLYSCGPTVVYECEPATGRLTPVARDDAAPAIASSFRGGSPGLALGDGRGWLFAIHEALDDQRGRCYWHRLVRLGDDLRLAAISQPFKLADARIEYCIGLVRWYDLLVFTFGVDDCEARMAVVNFDQALARIPTVPSLGALA